MKSSRNYIKKILNEGTSDQLKELFAFNHSTSDEKVLKKFELFSRRLYPRYFSNKSSDDHKEIVTKLIHSYRGTNELEAGYRGLAKTSIEKLFITFVLLNDLDQFRKYIKLVSLDIENSKSMVTDVYNLMVEVSWLYGDAFESEGKIKREETMGAFRLKDKKDPDSAAGIKVSSGTLGKKQRGHLQDNARPDWVVFEDIEDRDSISSQVQTAKAILKAQEVIDGLNVNGSYFVGCNYISEDGIVAWFMEKSSINTTIHPIATNIKYGLGEDGKKVIKSATPTWPERFPLEKIQDIFLDAEDWYGEYLCDPSNSLNKFFDIERIRRDIENAIEPEYVSAGVKYFKKYQANHRYGQGSDHSEGLGLDSNTLAGFDFNTGELAYTYANNEISPDLAAHEFARVGREYGNCIWAPETNNRCGGIVITTAKEIDYRNLYSPKTEDKRLVKLTNKVGWYTTKVTKTTAFMEFRTAYKDGLVIIYDIEVLKEMKVFTDSDLQDNNTGLITRHFDLLMAVVIAWQMNKYATDTREVKDFYKNLGNKKSATKARM